MKTNLTIETTYVLRLTKDELRLVISCLGDKLKDEHRPLAIALQEQLLRSKQTALSGMLDGVEKNLHNIEQMRQEADTYVEKRP